MNCISDYCYTRMSYQTEEEAIRNEILYGGIPSYPAYLSPIKVHSQERIAHHPQQQIDTTDQYKTSPVFFPIWSDNKCRRRKQSPPPRPGEFDNLCGWCGYDHTEMNNDTNLNLCKGRGSGEGSNKGAGGSGDRSGKRGSTNGGSSKGSGGNSRPRNNSGPNYYMNVDHEGIWTDLMSDVCFLLIVFLTFLFILGTTACDGTDNFYECVSMYYYGDEYAMSSGPRGCANSVTIPNHLQDQYGSFKKALESSDCLQRFSEKCPGLINYAGSTAGASIISTFDTESFLNAMMCKCQDSGRLGLLCDPFGNECSNCRCDQIGPETLIKEDTKLIPGQCWSFTGVGKVLIRLFYPIMITGVSIHHPAKEQLLPGFFSSAPKDFEVWGYNDTNDPSPHFFGKFQYTGDSFPTEIFEVKYLAKELHHLIQFKFLKNHGNPNYTAVYKVEVHGLLDRSLF